ncbi:HNH endonuclease signature motif containing protein [Microbacterium arabinogalactanolyticum]|uniref:HNH endonuclease signature motif containing protein n=1 Tax=Microbacterium arabinogalactanolyticum TaxID=69365 RepID=UPI002557A558|nr:HNH endonuclease signature motif containing protein [Microbacterium arabinogalactanolyticum]
MIQDFDALHRQRVALLDAWVSKQHEIARLQAEAAEILADRWELFEQELQVEPVHARSIERSMLAQYAATGHMSKGSMEFAFTDARMLRQFPAVRAAFADGRVTPSHVREIIRESQPVREAIDTGQITPDTLALYEQACLEVAERDTAARTRAHARQVAAALAGLTVTEQQQKAFSERTVTVRSVGDGLALLQAVLPEHLAVAIYDRLTKMAEHLCGHPEDRNLPAEEPTEAQWAAWEAEWASAEHSEQALFEEIARIAAAESEAAAAEAEEADGTQAHEEQAPDSALAEADCPASDCPASDGPAVHGADAAPAGSSCSDADADIEATFQELIARHLDADGFWPDDDDPDPGGPPPEPDLGRWTDPQFDPDSPCITRLPDELRTFDQLRADLLTDLLLASDPSEAHGAGLDGIRATIQVTVSATTLIGQDDRPGELDGHGPIRPEVARALAGSTKGWTRLFLDSEGFVTQTDTYTPTEPMVRFLRARDQHCRFPGCRQPIHRCERDHNEDWALGGSTSIDNLAHFCKTHHTLKHPDLPDFARWTARQAPDRTVQWTDPDGRTHRDVERPRVMFVPTDSLRSIWTDTPLTLEDAGSPF